ncbi:MAG: tetratricopeptide repeat protein [Paucibacter sp.]|nr:tetratricopeptide repeat protein [Roseateles sp.]
MQTRIAIRLAAACLLCLSCVLASAATPVEAAQKLWFAGQRQEAVAALESALERSPEQLQLRFQLGVYTMELGDLAKAEAIFTAMTRDFPDLADPFNNLAVVFAARGELKAAREALEQALNLQPDQPQALENLGDVQLRLAEQAYAHAARVQPVPSAQLASKRSATLTLVQQLGLASAPKP